MAALFFVACPIFHPQFSAALGSRSAARVAVALLAAISPALARGDGMPITAIRRCASSRRLPAGLGGRAADCGGGESDFTTADLGSRAR